MITAGWPWPLQPPEPYFTCQCNPPFEKEREEGSFYAHRIPIDCMTAEDWQRSARRKQKRAETVWVVNVIGDEDCGAPNDGAIGVFEHKAQAWALAMDQAVLISDEFDVKEDSIQLDYQRVVIEVKEMVVQ